jgi:nucleotide-binding universal stress UspA family protein
MESVLSHCKRVDACTKNVISANTVEQGIIDFLDKKSINLIAICTHGKSSIIQLFNPSITESIANHINLPILSVKLQ